MRCLANERKSTIKPSTLLVHKTSGNAGTRFKMMHIYEFNEA